MERTDRVNAALGASDATLVWVASQFDGLLLPGLSQDDKRQEKRTRIGAACLHIAIEHSQAVVVLVHEGCYGAARAMLRPLLEAWVRGMWLLRAASDSDVDRAGEDNFPKDFGRLIRELEERGGSAPGFLSQLKSENWKRLCSFNHTGYQQIGARLTVRGLASDYRDEEILEALAWADGVSLLVVIEFSALADRPSLATDALARLKSSNRQP